MAADDPLIEKMKNDTEVTADLAIFVALMRGVGAVATDPGRGRAPHGENCARSMVAKRTELRVEVH
jgi:hypothetical protein